MDELIEDIREYPLEDNPNFNPNEPESEENKKYIWTSIKENNTEEHPYYEIEPLNDDSIGMEKVRVKVDIPIKDVVEYPLVLEGNHTIWGDIVHNSSEEPNGYYTVSLPPDYQGMKEVRIHVNVPQAVNAKVWNMKNVNELEQETDVYLTENRTYNINQMKPNEDYVGFNPVRVKVPNATVTYTGLNMITESVHLTLEKMKDDYRGNLDKEMIVGASDIDIDIPNKTIPCQIDADYPDNPANVISGTTVKRTENGVYTVDEYKLEHIDDYTKGQLHNIIGFNQINVAVPNKLISMDNEVSNPAEDPYNTGTINVNGFYDINWWKNNTVNIIDKDDYIGFNNIRVNVQPKLLTDQPITIPNNNYVLNINTLWNNEHPNDLKDGFNNIIIHYNDSGNSNDLVNAVIQPGINSLAQTVVNSTNDVALKMITLNNQTMQPVLQRLCNGFDEIKLYLLQNRLNAQNQYMYQVNGDVHVGQRLIPERTVPVNAMITQEQLTQLNQLVGNEPNYIQKFLDIIRVKLVGVDEQGNKRFVNINTNVNNRLMPPPEEEQTKEPPKKRFRGETPLFEIETYINDYTYSTKDYNDENSTDYYATYSLNSQIQTEMLEYDTISINVNDNAQVVYDIDDCFYNTTKNPLIPDDENVPDGPGHYEYNPLGLRKLYINWPKGSNILLETIVITRIECY